MIRIGIAGIGRWGKKLLREFSNLAEIGWACHAGNTETADFLSRNFSSVKTTTDFNALLTDQTIEAVVIATPISTHFDFALRALEAGKHVFVEKPPATSSKELQKLTILAEETKKILFPGFIFAYHPAFQDLQQRISDDPVIEINTRWHKFGTFDEKIEWNLAIHDIYLCNHLLGKPRICETHFDGSDKIDIVLAYEKARARIEIDRRSEDKQKTFLVRTAGKTLEWINDGLFEIKGGQRTCLTLPEKASPLELECEAFLNQIKLGKTGLQDKKAVINTINILEQIK